MYTLSLRLQLDENIWCCKVSISNFASKSRHQKIGCEFQQLARGNHVFLYGMVLKFVRKYI